MLERVANGFLYIFWAYLNCKASLQVLPSKKISKI